MKTFDLEGRDFIALCDLLKLTGLTHSGGSAKMVIAEGLVLVDGTRETRKRYKVRPGQKVMFEGQTIHVTQSPC